MTAHGGGAAGAGKRHMGKENRNLMRTLGATNSKSLKGWMYEELSDSAGAPQNSHSVETRSMAAPCALAFCGTIRYNTMLHDAWLRLAPWPSACGCSYGAQAKMQTATVCGWCAAPSSPLALCECFFAGRSAACVLSERQLTWDLDWSRSAPIEVQNVDRPLADTAGGQQHHNHIVRAGRVQSLQHPSASGRRRAQRRSRGGLLRGRQGAEECHGGAGGKARDRGGLGVIDAVHQYHSAAFQRPHTCVSTGQVVFTRCVVTGVWEGYGGEHGQAWEPVEAAWLPGCAAEGRRGAGTRGEPAVGVGEGERAQVGHGCRRCRRCLGLALDGTGETGSAARRTTGLLDRVADRSAR